MPFLFLTSITLSAQEVAGRLKSHITYLASDELAGRKPGMPGDSMAAVYIRDQFIDAGAKPLGYHGFQYFDLIAGVKKGPNNRFVMGTVSYSDSTDFMPLSFSSNSTISAEVIFAGFGMAGTSGDIHWDDYAGIDVTGKWVMALRGDPEPDNPNSAFIPLATDRSKALAARDKGAAGLLLVSPSALEKNDVTMELNYDKSVSDAGIPVVSITRKLASDILRLPFTSIDSLEKRMTTDIIPIQIPTAVKISVSTDVIREKVTSRNVMAVIPGTNPDLNNEYIVIGAHYDHLGMGGPGSGSRVPDVKGVHGGADDNASGVASLIELARWFNILENRPSRSLLFVSFGAEEMGLLGSRYFVAHTPVDRGSIKAMINLDMVGRLKVDSPIVTISGTGTFTIADSLVDSFSASLPFEVKKVSDGYGPSDHASFYGEGIPVLYFTTGAHGEYHTPNDKVDFINFPGQVSVTEYVAKLVTSIADLPTAPIFKEAGARAETGHYSRSLRVKLGIMPDVSGGETNGGMKVEGVSKDGPANRAGMMKGDIITAINGLQVANIYDYMSRLGALKHGETANIEVLRDGKMEIFIVQL